MVLREEAEDDARSISLPLVMEGGKPGLMALST